MFNQIKNTFGGDIKCFASGAAPLSGELSEFLQVCFGVPILEGYGLTETAAACSMTINNGHVCIIQWEHHYVVRRSVYDQFLRWVTLQKILLIPVGRFLFEVQPCSMGIIRTLS